MIDRINRQEVSERCNEVVVSNVSKQVNIRTHKSKRRRQQERSLLEQLEGPRLPNMSELVKIINVRELEADLLAESPLSEEVDWASDTSSDSPELEGEAVRMVLERLATETGDPQEVASGPSTDAIRQSEVRVERLELTPEHQSALDRGVVGTSGRRRSRAKTP